MKFNGIIDLSLSVGDSTGNLQFAVLHKGTAFPTSPSPVQGQPFYKTDEDVLYIYDGDTWIGGSSGTSGYSGYSGISGYSGYSGFSGISGYSGTSGYSGNGTSGYSGFSGISGYSGSGGSGGYSDDFVNGDLSSGILTVTHSLGNKYVLVQVYNNNDKLIMPDEITLSSTTQLTIDLSSYGTITGTWHVIVSG